MAPPHRWFDAFIDAGWPGMLNRAALRLILAVARRVDKTLSTRIKLSRLLDEAGMPRATFFEAKRKLEHHRLLSRTKPDGKWRITLTLPVPRVHPTGPKSPVHRTRKSNAPDLLVQPTGLPKRESPPQTRTSDHLHLQTKRQLEGQTEGQSGVSRLETRIMKAVQRVLGQRLAAAPGVKGAPKEWLLSRLLFAAAIVQESPAQLEKEAHDLSRQFQAAGVLVHQVLAQELLQDVVMLLDPTNGQQNRSVPVVPVSTPLGGEGENDPLATAEDLAIGDGRGQLILRIGEARGWQPYPYAPGLSITAGKRAWLTFVRSNPVEELNLAIEAMRTPPAPATATQAQSRTRSASP